MRGYREIDQDIQKIRESQTKLQADLNNLLGEEQKILKKIDESVLAGNGSELTDDLVMLRGRKEAITQALDMATQKMREVQEERVSLERAEIGGKWPEVDRDLCARIEKIRTMTGKNGLNGELDGLYQALLSAEKVALYTSQDAQIKVRNLLTLYSEGARSLYALWKNLENIENTNRGNDLRDVNGDIPGFGRLPDRQFTL